MLRQIWIDLYVRLAAVFGRKTLNARAREEMEFHLSMREQQLMDRGLPAEEARHQARREFGNRLLLQETTMDSWRYSTVRNLIQDFRSDLRYAARSLKRTPGFATAAIVTIALGIGVNAGIFTILNGVLFRDLPAPDAHELVSISQTFEGVTDHATSGIGAFSTAEFRAYRERARTLSGLAAFTAAPQTTLGSEAPQEIFGATVSCNYFEVLRQPAALGRALSAQDCEPGAEPVVVLGHDLWKTTFAADSQILGRTVVMNRQRFMVVGVAAEGADVGAAFRTAYFAPISVDSLLRRSSQSRYENDKYHWLNLIGRRTRAVGLDQVRAEFSVIAAQIDGLEPGRSTTLRIERATPMTILDRSAAMAAAAVLMGAFALILLIACANVANLLIARGTARSHEIGIRLSLGASRARVVRQLLTESTLISIAGGLLGSVLALWSFQSLLAVAVAALSLPGLPAFAWDFSPDWRVLSFAAALTFGSSFLFGLAPALHVSGQGLHGVIKQDSAGAAGSRRGSRLRGTLVGVQVAVCMALMIAAGLLLRGLYTTYTTDPGFAYRDVAYVSLEPILDVYESAELTVLRQRLTAGIGALPGVEAVAYTDRGPLSFDSAGGGIRLPGESENDNRLAQLNWVTPHYFDVLGLPIVRGRTFTPTEVSARGTSTLPAIVSEATARNLWPGSDPIGRTLHWNVQDNTLQIVGVVADAQVSAIGTIDPYYVYVPGGGAVLLVKSRTDLRATLSSIRKTVQTLEPVLAPRVVPLESNLRFWRGASLLIATLGAILGLLALVLASVGIYGVVSYSVTRRYREIGIRLALGAQASGVLGMILRQTMRPVLIGATVGVAAAVAISRILSSVLFGVSPTDAIGFGGAVLLVVLVALAAGVTAARPGTRADPTTVLRYD